MKVKGILFLILLSSVGWGVGCQNKPCREIQAEKMAQQNTQAVNAKSQGGLVASQSNDDELKASSSSSQLKVKVYKPDGSLQCGMGAKTPLDKMEKELKGIKVFSRSNQNDGLMRIQVCGAPTGQCNVYEISRKDLDKALKAGFKEWTHD